MSRLIYTKFFCALGDEDIMRERICERKRKERDEKEEMESDEGQGKDRGRGKSSGKRKAKVRIAVKSIMIIVKEFIKPETSAAFVEPQRPPPFIT